ELVLLKQNIGASDGDSTPPEEKSSLPLIEVGVFSKNQNIFKNIVINILDMKNPSSSTKCRLERFFVCIL
ncbi:hypothetical protein, partial [Sporosalibacterium faouarense]|uniref:hypothetical protein n=1 Tax=Sporosalibacterium faouarense TaxID=516123 RepID=UPI001A9C496D